MSIGTSMILAALIAASLSFQQLPGDQWYEVGLEHFYNYEYGEAIDAFEQGIEETPNNPMLYLRLAQTIYLDSKRNNENGNPERNSEPDIFANVIEQGTQIARQQTNPNERRYLLGVLGLAEALYNYDILGQWLSPLSQTSAAMREIKPLVDDEDNPFHDAALFYYSLLSAQTGKNVGRFIGHTVLPSYGVPYHLDDGMRDLKAIAERNHIETTGAQLAFVEIMSTLNNRRNNNRHKETALAIAERLVARYPRNPAIRYHAILLYRKNGRDTEANILRDATLSIFANDARTHAGLLEAILNKIRHS